MGFFSSVAKKIKKQVKRSTKQVKAQVSRSSKQVEKQAKRSIDDAREVATKLEPYATAVLSVVDPSGMAATANSMLWSRGGYLAPSLKNGGGQMPGMGTILINPGYPRTGGTPLGQGGLNVPAPGQAFGGRPVATGFGQSKQPPKQLDLQGVLLIGGGILLLTLL